MNVWLRRLGGALCAAGLTLAALADARAETCRLELKLLERIERFQGDTLPLEYLYQSVRPQHFYMQIVDGRANPGDSLAEQFKKLVKKEPEEYHSKHPLRAVAKLGSREYCFVLDAEEPDSKDYGLLYFDRNLNGDLTDDEPISAKKLPGIMPAGYWRGGFPRIELTVEAGGEKFDYAFYFQAYANTGREEHKYVSASLTAAAYREGEITLDGKKRRVVLLDYDSNGRFDDVMKIPEGVQMADGRIYAQPGDMLLVDPETDQGRYGLYRITSNDFQHAVSRWANIEGRFYDLKVTPAGERLTLTRSEVAVGAITNANENFRAMVYSEDGALLKIEGGKDKPVPLPEGSWRLLDYTIDLTPKPQTDPEDKEKPKEEKSLLEVLVEALAGSSREPSRPRYTIISASGTRDYKPVRVVKGKTAEFPFGPPYTPVVKVDYVTSDKANLGLSIVGSADEVCTDLTVNGGRPDKPKFTISTKDGEEVTSGSFEYG